MKNVIEVVLLFLLWSGLFSQNPKYFATDYGWQFIQNGYNIFEYEDDFLMIGEYLNQNLDRWGGYLLRVDEKGEQNFLKEFMDSVYSTSFIHSIKTEKGINIVGLERSLNSEEGKIVFYQLSQNGDLLQKKDIITTEDKNIAYSISPTLNNGFLLGGQVWTNRNAPNPSYSDLHLVQIDSLGSVDWYKRYEYPYYCSIRKIVTDHSNQAYYVLASIHWVLNSGDLLLMKLDIEGNKIWEKVYDWGGEDRAKTMIRTLDGGFLISGYTTPGLYPYIMKVDSLGEVEWQRNEELFLDSATGAFLELSDGSFVLTGSKLNFPFSNELDLELTKIDAQGTVLWRRFYGGEDDDYGYDIITANNRTDGLDGFVISGRTESLPEPGANVYLVKTNCMGLLTEPQTSFSAEQDAENSLTYHFTNHSQYVYPDSIDGGHFLWDFGDGTTSEELHPSHEYTNKGEPRIVTLTAVVCSDTSMMDIKIVTGEEIVGIEGVDNSPAFSFKMYPNPVSNGQLRVEYDLPKEGVLQLFDLQGREMGYWILGIGYSQIDLGLRDFVEGMYFYRLSSGGEFLKSGKLVVKD